MLALMTFLPQIYAAKPITPAAMMFEGAALETFGLD